MKPDPQDEDLAMKIERIVAASGLPRSQIARDAGISYASLHAWLNRLRSPTPESLRRLAAGLRVRGDRLQELATELEHDAEKEGQT